MIRVKSSRQLKGESFILILDLNITEYLISIAYKFKVRVIKIVTYALLTDIVQDSPPNHEIDPLIVFIEQ
jgi:hypothetical protein